VPGATLAADDATLVIERIAGAPVAKRRRPQLEPPIAQLRAIDAVIAAIAHWPGEVRAAQPAELRATLRARLLEDPDDPRWIAEGARRCAARGVVPGVIADVLAADAPVTFAHGDALLRNMVADGDAVVLVDWECAGRYVEAWDRALVWAQLGAVARAELVSSPSPRFLATCAFAIARELRFLAAFRTEASHPECVRLRADIAAIAARIERAG
jgi:hypothetical protein